jgi:hypothetical protein
MVELNIFACADKKYEDFAPLFIASCLWSNPNATVEIGVDDADRFAEANRPVMARLAALYGKDAFLMRSVMWRTPRKRRILPNTVRFINEPVLPSEYIYISDIDIVTLEPGIASQHIADMARTGLPYSNWVRTGKRRLTGLHFSRRDWHYPLPPLDDLAITSMNDEELLYTLVGRKLGFDPPEVTERFRPVHGIHMSPNRTPKASLRKNGRPRPGWSVGPHRKRWLQFRGTDAFRDLEPHFGERIRTYVGQIDELINNWPGRNDQAATNSSDVPELGI